MRDRESFSAGRQSGLRFPGAAVAAALLLAAPQAAAHLFTEAGAGWNAGFSHPFSGLDHVLAMLAVGLWAAQIGRPALWLLPLAFPLTMALGGLLGTYGMPLPWVESGIAASVLVLGVMIALALKPPLWACTGLVMLFAVFHGHAHGTELPETASPALYGLGFVIATAILHAIGLGIGRLKRWAVLQQLVRQGGWAIAATGVVLFFVL